MPFTRPIIAGGDGSLVIDQLKSPNYDPVAGDGWAIFKDGDAVFTGGIQGPRLRLGPMNFGTTPYLNLYSYFSALGEVGEINDQRLPANYVTTTTATDPGFGSISLPLVSGFTGQRTFIVKVTVELDIQTSGAVIPSGTLVGQFWKGGSVDGSQLICAYKTANQRQTLSRTWINSVVYVAGAPQSTFTFTVRTTAGPDMYQLNATHSHLFSECIPVPASHLEA